MPKTTLQLYGIHSVCSLMETGKIVVPAFQRGFVWSKTQVLKLMRSIYQGYPVGTIIVVEQSGKPLNVLPHTKSLFPVVSDHLASHSTTWVVIDGAQRLAVLYNAFFGKVPMMRVWFDLQSREFMINAKRLQLARYIDLHALYSTQQYFQYQKIIIAADTRDKLLDRVNDLQRAFKDYQIPVQVLTDTTLEEAASMFQRLNRSGQQLTKAELQNAVKRGKKSGRESF